MNASINKTNNQLLNEVKDLKKKLKQYQKHQARFKETEEVSWQMHKASLERKNQELEKINQRLTAEREEILSEQRRIMQNSEGTPIRGKRLTEKDEKQFINECAKKYTDLLQAHFKNQTKFADTLCGDLCAYFLDNNIPIKRIVALHINSIKQTADSIDEMSARNQVSSARSILLMIMSRYAHLLQSGRRTTKEATK